MYVAHLIMIINREIDKYGGWLVVCPYSFSPPPPPKKKKQQQKTKTVDQQHKILLVYSSVPCVPSVISCDHSLMDIIVYMVYSLATYRYMSRVTFDPIKGHR